MVVDPTSFLSAGAGLFAPAGVALSKRLGEAWSKVRWNLAEDTYRQRVIAHLSRTRLLGAFEEIDLSDLFTDVYFLPEASATKRYRDEVMASIVDFDQIESLRAAERTSANELVAQVDRLYVLGTPGSGKSTFLKHIAIEAARGNIDKIPIYLSLKDWADSKLKFLDYAAHELDVCGFPESAPVLTALLEDGSAMLLLDGLDEVPTHDDIREQILRQILEVSRRYVSTKIYLTCRTASNDHSFSGWRYVEVSDFSAQQQDEFIGKWFASKPDMLDKIRAEFDSHEGKRLRDLGKKPLFLAFLCIVFGQLQEFPRSRSSLYEEALDVLLTRWDSSRTIKRETYAVKGISRKKQLLSQLAFRTFEVERFVFPAMMIESSVMSFLGKSPSSVAADEVEVDRLLRSFEYAHGIIVERAVGLFSFSHLSIHEYLAAQGMVNLLSSGRSWTALLPPDRAMSLRWRDVVVHAATILSEADTLVAHLQSCQARAAEKQPKIGLLLSRIEEAVADQQHFRQLFADPTAFFAARRGSLLDPTIQFKPSAGLASSVKRIVDSLAAGIQSQKVSGRRNLNSPLVAAWRRALALREILALPKGVPSLMGKAEDWERFDRALQQYVHIEELKVVLLNECMIGSREQVVADLLTSPGR